MRYLLLVIILCVGIVHAQPAITPGQYFEMNIAYDTARHYVTGFYENYTGYDETTKRPRFCCIFYFEGYVKDTIASILSYSPGNKAGDSIRGTLYIKDNAHFSIQLNEEHGGCWNVEPFAREQVSFSLTQAANWQQIRYATKARVRFCKARAEQSAGGTYIVFGDPVYIQRIEDGWAWCTYQGENKSTTGWVRLSDLNDLGRR